MARKNAKGTKSPSNQPEISEQEQWRIINETGLLKQLSNSPRTTPVEEEEIPFAEEILNAMLLIAPFTFLLVMMDIAVHQQYARKADLKDIRDRLVSALPILSIFIYYTNKHKRNRRVKYLFFIISLVVGPRLIWVVNRAAWRTVMQQAPPLAVLWIYTIFQMDLGPAVLSLIFVGVWFLQSGLRFFP
ncbi:hypothetical protein BDM02DRAFT_3111137 [Thelephora ganbajun]|uniref:Uncharacterized protein n=1 Tax=Thelephora ganbajun TaxID=370292 RepID=A0ACB6ZNL3_THEGA|nr:hypothetical protein BDM02DRAFT_3111137 [Thelephora ganbajun]